MCTPRRGTRDRQTLCESHPNTCVRGGRVQRGCVCTNSSGRGWGVQACRWAGGSNQTGTEDVWEVERLFQRGVSDSAPSLTQSGASRSYQPTLPALFGQLVSKEVCPVPALLSCEGRISTLLPTLFSLVSFLSLSAILYFSLWLSSQRPWV